MSTPPDLPPDDGLVTCPHCQMSFPASGEPASEDHPVAAAKPGTMTILPPDAAPGPCTPTGPTSTPQPARLGRFAVIRYLGEGAFGRVYQARDPLLKRTVALKVAKPEQLTGERRVERFQREARAAANLLHPHIVAVFDSGRDGPHHYIASAFVPGRSLADVLEEMPKGETLDLREAVQIVRKLAEALAFAHKQGIVHRDVKPSNVMVRDDGEPMLMDFGLAARLDETDRLTVDGKFMGTPEYTAPEQWAGRAEASSDQYSLGRLLFELVTGERPVAGGSSEHYLLLHTQRPAPSPRTHRPDLPCDLETICLKCLEKLPGQRYGDCQALADDLRRWLEGELVTARRPGALERLTRWTRRNPAVARLTLAVAVSLLLGVLAASIFAMQANNEAGNARRQAERANDEAKKARQSEVTEKKARMEAETNEKVAKVGAHGFQMTAAWQAWQQHDLVVAEALLDQVPMEIQQGWEYRHLRALCRRKALPLKGHTSNVTSVAYSPDGKRIVSGSWDNTVKVWDAATGQDLLTLKGHSGYVTSVAYSPDGKRIVSGSRDETVKVWGAATGQDLLTLKGHTSYVTSVAYSPDGKRLLASDIAGKILAWDATTGHLLPDAPAAMPADSTSVAVFGNLRARADGAVIRLERILSPEEQGLRQEEERIDSILRARATLEFHAIEAETAENNHQPFAAVFHLDRLLRLLPNQRRALLQRRNAVLASALKADAKDAWAVRTLARQAISDPDSVPDRKALLPALAKLAKQHDDAFTHRLHGGLLLRTGSPKEAIAALQQGMKKRDNDAPSVEELLLALAHIQRKEPAAARKHLQTAVTWMDRGVLPGKVGALAGLAASYPLAALGGMVVPPPDPRLEPLHRRTACELNALRAEVEKALAQEDR